MKIKNAFKILLFTVGLIYSSSLDAQITEPNFDWCEGVPTKDQIHELNRFLAFANAPVLYQQINVSHPHYDWPVPIDFDENLLSADNWQNAFDLQDTFNIPTLSAYYAVLWTEDYFVITYSFFYPRNWTDCNEGKFEHNNDLERVVVLLDRCNGESLLLSTHHGNVDSDFCAEETQGLSFEINNVPFQLQVPDDDNDSMIVEGNHPVVFVSWGSHAMYLSYRAAVRDGGNVLLPCHPNNWGTCWRFLSPSPSAGPIDLDNPCANGYYNLIDIFEPNGIWENRDFLGLFIGHDCYSDDNFLDGPFESSGASAPWNGHLGVDLLGTSFLQQLDHPAEICGDPINFGAPYIYNPYDCLFGGQLIASENQVCIGDEFTVSIDKQCTDLLNYEGIVEWSILDDSLLSCEGCDEGATTVVLTALGAGSLSISAQLENLSCGLIELGRAVVIAEPRTPFWEDLPESLCLGENYRDWDFDTEGWTNVDLTLCGGEGTISYSGGLLTIEVEDIGHPAASIIICWTANNACGDSFSGQVVVFGIDCGEGGGHFRQTNPEAIDQLAYSILATSERSKNTPQSDLRSLDPNDDSSYSLEIAPNPSSGLFSLQLEGMEWGKDNTIEVFDSWGRRLVDRKGVGAENLFIDLSNYPAGVYLLQLRVGEQRIVKKLVRSK